MSAYVHKNIPFQLGHLICQIFVSITAFDWLIPPNRSNSKSSSGTGFLLEVAVGEDGAVVPYVFTCFHVVREAMQIKVHFERFLHNCEATVVVANPEMDIAILKLNIPDQELREKLAAFSQSHEGVGHKVGLPVPVSGSDRLPMLAPVTAHGFPRGDSHMQITAGVLSGRIENRLQMDVAVNPGNSGGPVLNDEHQVIGVVTSGFTDAQGINFAAPITEVLRIAIRAIPKYNREFPVYDQLPSLNMIFSRGNTSMMEAFGLMGRNRQVCGIRCSAVHPKYDGKIDSLQEGDILVCISFNPINVEGTSSKFRGPMAEYEIDVNGYTEYPEFWTHGKLPWEAALNRLSIGESLKLKYHRPSEMAKGETRHIQLELDSGNLNTYRIMYPHFSTIEYIVLGGVFVMPLCMNHNEFSQNLKALFMEPSSKHRSFLIVTNILSDSPFKDTDRISAGYILVRINDKKLDDFAACKECWHNLLLGTQAGVKRKREEDEEDEKKMITLYMRDGSFNSANLKRIKEYNKNTEKIYGNGYANAVNIGQ